MDALILATYWEDKYFIDRSAAFCWALSSASFQILYNPIAYIMMQKGYKLYCYINDYIAVPPKFKETQAFNELCDLLNELGLPTSVEKKFLCNRLTYLDIEVDIGDYTRSIAKKKK